MRNKTNWLAIISDYGLESEFDFYRFHHETISLNRAARSFVVSKACLREARNNPKYIKGCEKAFIIGVKDDGTYDSPSMVEARKRILGL